ncbi:MULTISPECIES: oligoribonuclease [Acidithrix]|nr:MULTISPECIES: oligoribonuclease [Acidithrix]
MLVWIDLEMTGLDPKRHVIVEIATIITNDELEVIEVGPDLVINASEEQLLEMDSYVKSMHSTSGLLEEIRSSTETIQSAETKTLDFIKSHIKSPRSSPLCGNTIGTDRRFLAEHASSIDDYLHYRSIDVSSIKELARRWAPKISAETPTKKRGHRALDDIMESIEELRYYRESFFKKDS